MQMNLCWISIASIHSSRRKFHHKKKRMFERNYNKEYHTLLISTMPWIKNILKRILTPMISLSMLRYVSLINEGQKTMAIVTKRMKDNEGNPIRIEHSALFAYHSL